MAMTLMEKFFAADWVSLKICGITRAEDARGLVECGVEALGVNFWPLSKRFISPDDAAPWLHEVKGQIVRVGVFVNAQNDFIEELMRQDLIDVVQLHGDESSEQMAALQARGIPCVRA
jgi:phosphoribosylanthranilate isomerase